MPKLDNLDPLNIQSRLYNQVSELLKQLETGDDISIRERFLSLAAISKILLIFQNMRLKEGKDEPTTGSAVRKYAATFQAHDARRRKALARSAAADADGDDLDLGDDDDADDRDSA